MNKLELSIELSFDIDAGTIEPFDDVKLNTNRLIHPEVFFERYQNYKMDLKDKAYIDTTAQQVLKIAISEPFISYMKQRSYNVKVCSIQ